MVAEISSPLLNRCSNALRLNAPLVTFCELLDAYVRADLHRGHLSSALTYSLSSHWSQITWSQEKGVLGLLLPTVGSVQMGHSITSTF